MRARLEALQVRFAELERLLADPKVFRDTERLRSLGREHAQLAPILRCAKAHETLSTEIAAHHRILDDSAEDPDLRTLAAEEIPSLEARQQTLADNLQAALNPRDPLDERTAIVELRAGTGGEEAALFTADLLRMYLRYAERQGWRQELLGHHASPNGGVKEAIVALSGGPAYGRLRYEGGVHRVQRVPRTESQGRIHTSAATVVVLPETEETTTVLRPEDLRIDVFRSSGPGGQSVNTTDSAVRITHVPTGLSAQSQDEKSQHRNRARALRVLQARVADQERQQQREKESRQRREMVGSGDRSERIRTYNFPQSRITDHRCGLTLHRLDETLDGDLGPILNALANWAQQQDAG